MGRGKESREGNMRSSFSLSSLRSPRLCGEIFCSAGVILEGEMNEDNYTG